jgi:hypothetical protein
MHLRSTGNDISKQEGLQTVRDRIVRNITKHVISNSGSEFVLAKVTQNNNALNLVVA